jgi:hypothetical protein
MLTGIVGRGFGLDYLSEARLEDTAAFTGVERQIWRPARFSAIS